MHDRERATLERLVARLLELEGMDVATHDRPIVDVARASLLDAITAVSHCLCDGDYFTLRSRGGRGSPG